MDLRCKSCSMPQARMRSQLIRSKHCGLVLPERDAKVTNAFESCHTHHMTNWKLDPLVYLWLMPLNNWENFGTRISIYDIRFCNYGLLSRVDSKWLSRANLHSEKTFCYCWNSHGWWLSSLRLGTGHISNWFQLGTYSGLSSKLHTWHGVANDSEKIWWEICYNYWFWVTSKLLGRLPEFKQSLL